MEPEIQALIDAHAPYLRALDGGKVECTLNGHAFAPRKDVIEAFLNGKKFQKLKKQHNAELDLGKYKPFLSDSLNFSGMVFCSLTNQLIAKDKDKIEAHVGGRRYQSAQARHEAGELELWAEPTPEEMEAMEAEMMEEMEELERMEAAARGDGDGGGDGDGDEDMEDGGNMVDAFLREIGEISDSEEEEGEEGEEEEEEAKPAPKQKKAAAGGGSKAKAAAPKAKAGAKEKKKPAAEAAAKGKGKKQPSRGPAPNGKPAKKARK